MRNTECHSNNIFVGGFFVCFFLVLGGLGKCYCFKCRPNALLNDSLHT